ncbi:MAG: Hsp70 family protein [Gammaproteobacteria bacterium]|nr:Hsp70 family protein [Gammaproteobacteria bacterium]
MNERIFGLDFGTTNSLAAFVADGEVRALTDNDEKPLPSVVWYRGSETVVGRTARAHIDSLDGGGTPGFVRSPKMMLRRDGPVHIDGRALDAADIVSEVLAHVRSQAELLHGHRIDRAVLTVPVDFAGPERRALRIAARKAGISVVHFVHEPAAALYAYLRNQLNYQHQLALLENKAVLVFDWGGGTVDLSICRVLGGVVKQIANRGNDNVGGDHFDERLRNHIRDKHSEHYGIFDLFSREQPGAAATLLSQCELAKIELSVHDRYTVLARDYIVGNQRERNLSVDVTRNDLEALSHDLVRKGLEEIDIVLEQARLDRHDIELCLATGGMVNMPIIWNGLIERFGARVPKLVNRDRIIAEGAAWIAHDQLGLQLSKPLEILVAGDQGRGEWLPLVDAEFSLPVENETAAATNRRFYCTDPRDGQAVFEFGKPRKVGLVQPKDERETVALLTMPVDQTARPLLERLECKVQIDHDYVAKVTVASGTEGRAVEKEIHSLDFGLALPQPNER